MNTFNIVDKLGGWNNILDGFTGWSIGYQYSLTRNKEDEVKQGKNYLLSCTLQVAQVGQLSTLIQRISSAIPNNPYKIPIAIGCNVLPFACVPLFLLAGAVKMGFYSQTIPYVNHFSNSYIKLPPKLSVRTIKVLCFISEHGGKLMHGAFFAGTVALIALGRVAEGGAIFTAIAFSALDQKGWIPRKISLWSELYMGHITSVGMLITGTLIAKITGIFSLMSLFSQITHSLHYYIDSFVRTQFQIPGPTLRQIDAPVVPKTDFTYDDINKIITADDRDFKINYSHCSKMAYDFDKLKRDNQFKGFLDVFDTIDWEKRFPLILKKISDDERFLDMLFDHFPDFVNHRGTSTTPTAHSAFLNKIETYIEQLALKKGISKEKYAASWMRDQMTGLVNFLEGKVRPKGMQQDLSETIEYCSIILPYLKSSSDSVVKEDILIKLAIEGGNYCARGSKRASSEIVYGIVEAGVQGTNFDQNKNYEMQCTQALQNTRLRLAQQTYNDMMNDMNVPRAVSQDTHSFDIYRNLLTLGVYPLTPFERKKIGFMELLMWEGYAALLVHLKMYKSYKPKIDDAIGSVGEIHFGNYILNMINTNSLLTDVQKTDILDKYINNDDWSPDEVATRFHKLLLVKLGILSLK